VLMSAVLARPVAHRSIVLAEAIPLAATGLVGIPIGAALLDVLSAPSRTTPAPVATPSPRQYRSLRTERFGQSREAARLHSAA
jgi:hypothetical protein